MTSSTGLESIVHYSETAASVTWQGLVVTDSKKFTTYLRDVVGKRVADSEQPFDTVLQGLATTGMSTTFVAKLLKSLPNPEEWEIGEALAECTCGIACRCEVIWPWNTVRDRRTPRASLPGADLVGFHRDGGSVLLLFGEVKTSSDAGTPPNVMYGKGGMTWQLEQSAQRLDIQMALLKWLYARCREDDHRTLFEKAVSRFIQSEGKEFLLVGVLVRDTAPNALDLRSRGQYLAQTLDANSQVKLTALYLPIEIGKWSGLLQGGLV